MTTKAIPKNKQPCANSGTPGYALTVLLSLLSFGNAMAAGQSCSDTTHFALQACTADNNAVKALATARCANKGTKSARFACIADADSVFGTGEKQCKTQQKARQSLCKSLGEAAYDPAFRPANFVSAAEAAAKPNRYFPLLPGMRQVYRGDGETNVIEVLDEIKHIGGVECRTVHDTVSRRIGGVDYVLEDTLDWFAQDKLGNVWYCGEISASYDYISVDHARELRDVHGSWKALRDGALPGIVMYARPKLGKVYRQEFDIGNAEDVARIVSITRSATATVGTCTGTCVVTRDFTPLSAGGEELKIYAPGFGLIKEIDAQSGEVTLELVEMTTPVLPM